MRQRISWCGCWLPLLAAGLCSLVASAGLAGAPAGDVAVVAHPGVPVDDLKLVELRRILLGDKQYWTSNLRVTLLIRSPRPHGVVLKRIYQMNEEQYRRYWSGKLFRAEIPESPTIIFSNAKATELAATIRGAIGLVDADDAAKGVKIIKVDGHLPGEKAYPLR